MPNFKSVVYFLVVDFGGGCSCCSCCCDRGKTKSTPCPFDLDWNRLGLEFDNKANSVINCTCKLEQILAITFLFFKETKIKKITDGSTQEEKNNVHINFPHLYPL